MKLCGSLVDILYKCSTKFQIFVIIVKNSRHITIESTNQFTSGEK